MFTLNVTQCHIYLQSLSQGTLLTSYVISSHIYQIDYLTISKINRNFLPCWWVIVCWLVQMTFAFQTKWCLRGEEHRQETKYMKLIKHFFWTMSGWCKNYLGWAGTHYKRNFETKKCCGNPFCFAFKLSER
jgi:hypothetical protein